MSTWDESIMNDNEYPNIKTNAGTKRVHVDCLVSCFLEAKAKAQGEIVAAATVVRKITDNEYSLQLPCKNLEHWKTVTVTDVELAAMTNDLINSYN